MLSCETYEFLKKTAGGLLLISRNILELSLVLSAKLSSTSRKRPVHKRLTMFALEIFKDNQNIAKFESNILLVRSIQQRKWMAVHKRLTMFTLEIFKDNQDIAKFESNIFLVRSIQQRKWMVSSRINYHLKVFRKKELCSIRQTHWKTSLAESFFSI